MGMRFGALFAASSADEDGDVDQLVLWDPCNSGQSFLAEGGALARLSAGARLSNLEDGALETPGIVYGAATAADIRGLNIDQCTRPLSRRVLVLERTDRPLADNLYDGSLARETLTRADAVGQLELMDLVPPVPRATPHDNPSYRGVAFPRCRIAVPHGQPARGEWPRGHRRRERGVLLH